MAHLEALSKANFAFASDMYSQVAERSKNDNAVISPLSLHAALALLTAGAGGATLDELRAGLRLAPDADLAAGYAALMPALKSAADVTLDIANRVYVAQSYKLQPAYADVVTKSYGAGVENVDFAANKAAADHINAWVMQSTRDKIKDLISPDSLDGLTRAVLVNAVYFKGDWANKFDPAATAPGDFTLLDGTVKQVDMMHKTMKVMYRELPELNATAVMLPYKNPDLAMVVVLPDEKAGLPQVEAKLRDYDLAQLVQGMRRVECELSLPKFKIETTLDLKETLEAMKMGGIFTDSANFTNMIDSKEQLKVSKVVQKAFIEVNEEGSEAAAATGMMIMTLSMPMPVDTVRMTVDRPFIATLFHKVKRPQTRTQLFTARVLSP